MDEKKSDLAQLDATRIALLEACGIQTRWIPHHQSVTNNSTDEIDQQTFYCLDQWTPTEAPIGNTSKTVIALLPNPIEQQALKALKNMMQALFFASHCQIVTTDSSIQRHGQSIDSKTMMSCVDRILYQENNTFIQKILEATKAKSLQLDFSKVDHAQVKKQVMLNGYQLSDFTHR